MIAYEGFILKNGTIIGFFPDGVRVDTGFNVSDYSQLKHYNDDILLEVKGITKIGEYDLIHNNCQDWISRVEVNYYKLAGKS